MIITSDITLRHNVEPHPVCSFKGKLIFEYVLFTPPRELSLRQSEEIVQYSSVRDLYLTSREVDSLYKYKFCIHNKKITVLRDRQHFEEIPSPYNGYKFKVLLNLLTLIILFSLFLQLQCVLHIIPISQFHSFLIYKLSMIPINHMIVSIFISSVLG